MTRFFLKAEYTDLFPGLSPDILRGQTEAMKAALADNAELSPYELAQAAARLPRSTAVPPPAAVNAMGDRHPLAYLSDIMALLPTVWLSNFSISSTACSGHFSFSHDSSVCFHSGSSHGIGLENF